MANSEMLRSAIDKGTAGFKICAVDPAAAPMGADDEAAGTPATAHQIDTAMASESNDPAKGKLRRARFLRRLYCSNRGRLRRCPFVVCLSNVAEVISAHGIAELANVVSLMEGYYFGFKRIATTDPLSASGAR